MTNDYRTIIVTEKLFTPLSNEQKEAAIKHLLQIAASQTNLLQLKCVLQNVHNLVMINILTAQ